MCLQWESEQARAAHLPWEAKAGLALEGINGCHRGTQIEGCSRLRVQKIYEAQDCAPACRNIALLDSLAVLCPSCHAELYEPDVENRLLDGPHAATNTIQYQQQSNA